MKTKIIFVFLFGFCSVSVFSQNTAEDYYHSAANLYINANKKAAKNIVNEAISKFPNDKKLRELSSAIDKLPEQPPQPQKPQQQQQQQQPQMSKEQAEKILKALEQDEKDTQDKRKIKMGQKAKVEKEW